MFRFTFFEDIFSRPLIDRPTDIHGQTALHFASKSKCKETVEMLFNNNADATVLTSNKKTILHSLLEGVIVDEMECIEIIKLAVLKGASLTSIDGQGTTLLHLAAKKKLKNVLIFLLPHFDCDEVTVQGATALHILINAFKIKDEGKDFVDVINLMLDKNPNLIFICNKIGQTPLHLAAQNQQLEIVKMLLPFYQ